MLYWEQYLFSVGWDLIMGIAIWSLVHIVKGGIVPEGSRIEELEKTHKIQRPAHRSRMIVVKASKDSTNNRNK